VLLVICLFVVETVKEHIILIFNKNGVIDIVCHKRKNNSTFQKTHSCKILIYTKTSAVLSHYAYQHVKYGSPTS
jgi:putative cell wall-binding protein